MVKAALWTVVSDFFVGICFYFSWVNKRLEPWNCQLTGLTAHSLRGSPQRGRAAFVTRQRYAGCCCPTPGHTGHWSLLQRSARGVLSSEVGVERESLSVAEDQCGESGWGHQQELRVARPLGRWG